MRFIERPLLALLIAGLFVCLTLSSFGSQPANADERDEAEFIESDEEKALVVLQDRRERAIDSDVDDDQDKGRDRDDDDEQERERADRGRLGPGRMPGGPRGERFRGFAPGPPPRDMHEREMRDRDMRRPEMPDREMHERENREREMHEREMHEREMREREMHEREMHEREIHEREMRQREEMERREQEEHAERERNQHRHALETEMLELEVRGKHLELRMIEIEVEERAQALATKENEAAIDAIEMASRFLEPPAAADFFAGLLDRTESPEVRRHLRVRLVSAFFMTDRPDQAREQLQMLIAPPHERGR